jgi:autotransporter translocation and assembly factor TamB
VRRARLGSIARGFGRAIVYIVATVLAIVGIAIAVVETGWAKNRIRELIVRQANQYLSATLEIGRLEGSIFRGLQLGDIKLSRNNQPIITIDEVSLSYSLRELWQNGTVIQRIRLVRPSFALAKEADGRWNIAALVKRDARQEKSTGPGRPIQIVSIEIVDGRVVLGNPLEFGAAHVPTDFESLNTSFAFEYRPVHWTLTFANASWVGSAPDLTMSKLSGVLANSPSGWRFDRFAVQTPRSAFSLTGTIERDVDPTRLDLLVTADRFAFQEWSGIIRGLKNIAVDAAFTTRLTGPVNRLQTDLRLTGTGGSIAGQLVLDTSVPGWHGSGAVDIARLDLARWLNRADRPSDITGHVGFNLDLDLGHHFPRGTYAFDGPHVSFMDYAADRLRAHGVLTATEVQIADATAIAYGAGVTAAAGSTIGLDEPFPFRFVGTIKEIDLRQLPKPVPVPHVESRLTFDYDVNGRFSEPFIAGRAHFASSTFLAAAIGADTVGTIDTSTTPIRYSGEGDISQLDLNHFGEGLDVAWMQDPRYAGTISGHFRVDGAGSDRESLALTGGGRITHAALFDGSLMDADVTLELERGSIRTSFDGRFDRINPPIVFGDSRVDGRLSGSANVRTSVRDLLARTVSLTDYDIDGTVSLQHSTIHNSQIDDAEIQGKLAEGIGRFTRFELSGPALAGHGSGTIAFVDDAASSFDYDISRADLGQLRMQIGGSASGVIATTGHLTGPYSALRLAGDATLTQLNASGMTALNATGKYDVTIPGGSASGAQARIDADASFLNVGGVSIEQAHGTVTKSGDRFGFDLQLASPRRPQTSLQGAVLLDTAQRDVQIQALTVTFGRSPWRLATSAPMIRWSEAAVVVDRMAFTTGAAGDQRVEIGGDWREDGGGALHVTGSHIFLETLEGALERPARYAGVLDLNATIGGTREQPTVTGDVTIVNGRVRRVSYEKLAGHVDYSRGNFVIDFRVDEAPGVWLTAKGTVPRSLFDASLPEQPIDVAVLSSPINLALLEGLTDVVTKVRGTLRIDVKAVGTSRDPHFDGLVEVSDAGFLTSATGSTYKNAHAVFRLARDRITVDRLHIEDANGHPLDVNGSLATHELKVGNLQIDAVGKNFEVIHNEYGRVEIDTSVHLGGRLESARVSGDITIKTGDVHVDRILERALFQPYSTQEVSTDDIDPIAALNPWDRLGLDVSLHVPNTLKLTGDNVQVSPGTPIGLGSINLRVAGDLYLYKDPAAPLSVTGSFDSVSGTYAFQGRRFDVDEASSINFRGDLNPEIYVSVTRVISGVTARVTINGPLRQPELHLSSTPPLDSSDILSLIVFNTAPNELSVAQQQELAVRAGALAAGFIATPIVSALQNEIGIDTLEVEPAGDLGVAPKVTVGEEIAPGLVARFSRQFGAEPYDEATIEYYLSRILRLRATFSDAQSLEARSPFRRIERAGIDLLFFFSF